MSGTSYRGHRMVSRMGPSLDPEQMARVVRKMRIIGFVVGAVLVVGSVALASMNGGFEWTSYHSGNFRSSSGTGLSNEATGLVGGALIMLAPFTFGWAFRTAAGNVLYLNGTELTVVKPGKPEPQVFHLTRSRAQVRLDKVPGSRPGSAEVRKKVGTHRPVLVLFPESGGKESVIELANQRTRAMRQREETRMFADAMRYATDPAIQHAAGQLRTVLRWTTLPVIHEASPDAIPASPTDESAPLPRVPVVEGTPSPEIEIVGRYRG